MTRFHSLYERTRLLSARQVLPDTHLCYQVQNSSCGDVIGIELWLDGRERVLESKWFGMGCAVSQTAADLLTKFVKGRTLAELKAFSELQLLALLGIPVSGDSLECAFLPWRALRGAIAEKEVSVAAFAVP